MCVATLEHVQSLRLLRRANMASASPSSRSSMSHAPVEVLALSFNIGHAITDLPLLLLPRFLLLSGPHLEVFRRFD